MQPEYYKRIFGWMDFEDVYDRAVAEARDCAVFVEIGCLLGKSACYIAEKIRQSGKRISILCVDHFRMVDDPKPVREIKDFLALNGGNLFFGFWQNTAPFRDIITPVCLPSIEAVKLFPDGFADFIFIDAGHDEDNINADIAAWLPKVKKGGMLAGHDYDMRDVRLAVDDWFPDRKLMSRCWLSRDFDDLAIFSDWYFKNAGGLPRPPMDNLSHVGEFSGQVLYRNGPFQVQVWTGPPGASVEDHRHPAVDTIQVYLSGQIYLRINGEEMSKPESVGALANGVCNMNGVSVRILPTDYHGFKLGPFGGSWMTIERWLSGMPTSTELSWEGQPINDEHAATLQQEEAIPA